MQSNSSISISKNLSPQPESSSEAAGDVAAQQNDNNITAVHAIILSEGQSLDAVTITETVESYNSTQQCDDLTILEQDLFKTTEEHTQDTDTNIKENMRAPEDESQAEENTTSSVAWYEDYLPAIWGLLILTPAMLMELPINPLYGCDDY